MKILFSECRRVSIGLLSKIEECTVFVADLSFVGESKNGFKNASGKPRQFPNPNVLIEHGYALRCHSHSKIIGVMNTAYGKRDAESLPFDLRHLRWPIPYYLADIAAADSDKQFENLVQTLAEAIGLIISNHSEPNVPFEKFIPQKPTKNLAVYFENDQDLIAEGPFGMNISFTVPDGAKMYLRVYPSVQVPPIETEFQAKNLAAIGNLQPIGNIGGLSPGRNIYGGIVYEAPQNDKLFHFTQLFLSREIWGIDAMAINNDYIRANFRNEAGGYIANGYIEDNQSGLSPRGTGQAPAATIAMGRPSV
jgi:hypothetical protein